MSNRISTPYAPSFRQGMLAVFGGVAAAGVVAWLIVRSLTHAHAPGPKMAPPFWVVGVVPFVALLSSIAVLPLIPATHHWWERNRNRLLVSLVLGGATLVYVLVAQGAAAVPSVLEHAVVDEYLPFMALLFSLYVIGGGISLRGDLPAHPWTNTAFLAVGALLASFIGTTGASMLLIRALLQTNAERTRVTHTVVFFIFLVSNVGGCLLPIGDPPLFLGYLRGVPFFWTLALWKPWLFCTAALLMVYFLWDTFEYRREPRRSIARDESVRQPLRLRGWINFPWLAVVVAAVAMLDSTRPVPGASWVPFPFMRELVMLVVVVLSLLTTPAGVRHANRFTYAAILEVAALFIGIFITMQVPLAVLHQHGQSLGLDTPHEFFWITGMLSSFLDNAPTYVVFLQTANTLTTEPGPGILQLTTGDYVREDLLVAISLGAVFMGAATYIGNGPNFMVKSIAEQSRVHMPSFFGYFFRFAVPVLLPVFALAAWLFL